MGTYTRLSCKIKLRNDTPNEVIDFLKNSVNVHYDAEIFPISNHEFFGCERWEQLFSSTSGSNIKGGSMTCHEFKNYWILELETEFKNYDSEIKKFFEWVKPYIRGRRVKQYLGYSERQDIGSQRLYWRVNLQDENREFF